MMNLRLTGLLLGILVTWVAVGQATVLAHREIPTLANKGRAIGNDQEIHGDKTKGADAGRRSKWVGGRKMGVENVKKLEVRGTVNTGKTEISLNDSVWSSKTKDTTDSKPKSRASTNTNMKNQGGAPDPPNLSSSRQGKSKVSESSVHANESYDASQSTARQNLQEATAELFRTLNKDYHDRARRRPPINNNLPLLGENNVNP